MNRQIQLDSQIRHACAEVPPTCELEGKIVPEVHSKSESCPKKKSWNQKVVQTLNAGIVLNL